MAESCISVIMQIAASADDDRYVFLSRYLILNKNLRAVAPPAPERSRLRREYLKHMCDTERTMTTMLAREPEVLRKSSAWIRDNVSDLGLMADCVPMSVALDDAWVDDTFGASMQAMENIYLRRCHAIIEEAPALHDIRPLTHWVRDRFPAYQYLLHLDSSGELDMMTFDEVLEQFGEDLALCAMQLMMTDDRPYDRYLDWISDADEDLLIRHVFNVARLDQDESVLDMLVRTEYLELFSYDIMQFVFGPRIGDAMFMRWKLAYDRDPQGPRSQTTSQAAHIEWLETVPDRQVLLAHLDDTGIIADLTIEDIRRLLIDR